MRSARSRRATFQRERLQRRRRELQLQLQLPYHRRDHQRNDFAMIRCLVSVFALALFASFQAASAPDTTNFPPRMQSVPLYGDAAIPNSKPGPDEETGTNGSFIRKVSRPQIQVYLPAKAKATGASVVIFPGGSY